jgi:hypothetical protein
MHEVGREGWRERERVGFFSLKKINWEATVLPNALGSIVASQ